MDFRYYTNSDDLQDLQKYLNKYTANITVYGDSHVEEIPYMLNSRGIMPSGIVGIPGWTITCLLDQILPDAITINNKTYWLCFEKDETWEISYRTADNKQELVSFKQDVNESMIVPAVKMTKWCGERDYIPDSYKNIDEQTY